MPNPPIISAQVAGSGTAPALGSTRRLLTGQSPELAVTPAGRTKASDLIGISNAFAIAALGATNRAEAVVKTRYLGLI